MIAAVLSITGCAARVGIGYNAYDPYYGDYHYWGDPEPGLYNQWIVETHRPPRDFRRLKPEEQHQYFDWRHSHGSAARPAPAAQRP